VPANWELIYKRCGNRKRACVSFSLAVLFEPLELWIF
jgi:hypothetical protein